MSNLLIIKQGQGELEILPDNDKYKNRFEIKSETSNKIYTIAQNKKTLIWSCSCFGWIRYRSCKHLVSLNHLLNGIENEQKQLGSH